MPAQSLDRQLSQLSQLETGRYQFGAKEATKVVRQLKRLDNARFLNSALLIRFHEALLFLRAFPHSVAMLRTTERILNRFYKKLAALREAGADMGEFDDFDTSGIAGTQMEDTLGFDVARWLINARRMNAKVEISWDNYEPGRELGNTGPRFLPLLADDAFVEADTPWRRWLEIAAGQRTPTPSWLIERFSSLSLTPQQKTELYDSLRLPLRWELKNSALTRTRNWTSVQNVFYHREPLISRSDVSLANELARRPPKLTKLSRQQGEDIIELIREVMLVRYRELYGTTLGDPRSVMRADVGRGVTIFLWNLPPDRRLPLRAYVAGLTLKNGVPINYIEAIGLCEWMEVGFNTFYTFRGGEAGWIYAQVLRCLCHRMGTTCVSVYPYQLGLDNDEAIESGAFWFYRKLGFRPGRSDLRQLAEREEKKIASNPKYRTPARTLKRLAAGHVFHELPGSEVGAWDRFSTRHLGLRITQRMARDFGGNLGSMRQESTRSLQKTLRVNTSSWKSPAKAAFEDFALLLADAPVTRTWTKQEKENMLSIIRAKTNSDEMSYLRLTQQHAPLRKLLLTLGSPALNH